MPHLLDLAVLAELAPGGPLRRFNLGLGLRHVDQHARAVNALRLGMLAPHLASVNGTSVMVQRPAQRIFQSHFSTVFMGSILPSKFF